MLWHLGLEVFDQRYTKDWYDQFRAEYEKAGIEYRYVSGFSLTDKIEKGRFLDIFNTMHWKMSQMATVAKLFRDGDVVAGDVFLTCDLWHPGIEAIRYMSQLANIPVRVYGILHAGTYDPHDFTAQAGLREWARWSEMGWMTLCDKIFVGTRFHKDLIAHGITVMGHARRKIEDKIVVTGLPFYGIELNSRYAHVGPKEDLVVFPNRLDPEKQPWQFDEIVSLVRLEMPNVRFVKTAELCKTKDEYYRTLAKAKVAVSTSLQETFGYAMLEATSLGCNVVVPDDLSYREIYGREDRYNPDDLSEAAKLVIRGLKNHHRIDAPKMIPITYEGSIGRMLIEMGYRYAN